MNIFILGLPKSGCTTVALSLKEKLNFGYLNVSAPIKENFRKKLPSEHEQQYMEEWQHFFFDKYKNDPDICIEQAKYRLNNQLEGWEKPFLIEGVIVPKDFIELFDPQQDIIIFLNRTDNNEYFQDHDNISLATMKDYCFWASAAGLLNKPRWIEYNFKIPGEDSDYIKILGSKNTVYLVKSIDKVISHLENQLLDIM